MQTVKAEAADLANSTSCYTKILFDSGSQRSYISTGVRNKLQIKTIRQEKVIIKTFVKTNENEVNTLDIVKFKITKQDGKNFTFIEALCVPQICSPLTKQNI